MAIYTRSTTTPAMLSYVSTIQYGKGKLVDQTSKKFGALNFGTIGPGEKSKTVITVLSFPAAQAIKNIKIGLVNAGGITFANNIFGVTFSSNLDEFIVPETYFQGINTDKSSTNEYNIAIENQDSITSNYVYLNIDLPKNTQFQAGVVRYQWWFDYAD